MWSQILGVGRLDGRAFTKLVAKVGVETGRLVDPRIDLDQMRIVDASGYMSLRNLHGEFLRLPRRERLAFVRDRILAPVDQYAPPAAWVDARPLLRPVIRSAHFVACAELDAEMRHDLAYRAICDGLFATVVLDAPDCMMLVRQGVLAGWGVTIDDALDVAMANLRKESLEAFVRRDFPGIWAAPWHDVYASARALLPEILQRTCTNPLVAIPTRDVMFIADPSVFGAPEVLMTMMAADVDHESYPITRQIFQLVEKTLLPWTPSPTANAEFIADYQRKVLLEQGAHYHDEKTLHERAGAAETYQRLSVYRLDTGEVFTRTTWRRGDVAQLPPAQAIVFIDTGGSEERVWTVPWTTVVDAGFVTRTNGPLPRWRTGEFPPAAWLDAHQVADSDAAAD